MLRSTENRKPEIEDSKLQLGINLANFGFRYSIFDFRFSILTPDF